MFLRTFDSSISSILSLVLTQKCTNSPRPFGFCPLYPYIHSLEVSLTFLEIDGRKLFPMMWIWRMKYVECWFAKCQCDIYIGSSSLSDNGRKNDKTRSCVTSSIRVGFHFGLFSWKEIYKWVIHNKSIFVIARYLIS